MKSPASVHSGRLLVSIFCGGRGGSNLIREFLRHPSVELNALINAYDDGLSTGELRGLIPGMLGPSDFRKNLSNFLHLHSSHQYAITQLLNFRLPDSCQEKEIERLKKWAHGAGNDDSMLPENLRPVVRELDQFGPRVRSYLAAFFEYQTEHDPDFKFTDCSLGNLIFSGAYLKNNRNFNAAATELAREFHSKAKLFNVTQGENRILVALKENGEILERESAIVGPQSSSRITDFFFLEKPLTSADLERLRAQSVIDKRTFLRSLEKPVTLSPEARDALLQSDIIIYGPGTQFSSLFPSYKTEGVGEVIAASRARIKVFVVNIHRDHDIQAFSAADLVGETLQLLRDPRNERRSITHVLYTNQSSQPDQLVPKGTPDSVARFGNLEWIEAKLEHPVKAGAHSGYNAFRRIFQAYEETLFPAEPELDIYINLYRRSLAVDQFIQEFIELPWPPQFKRVRLRFNNVNVPALKLPPHLVIESVRNDELFSEVSEVSEWASSRQSKYLATISGDGEYRLRDVLNGIEILTQHSFAAVYGSRNQSRNQFYRSLDAAYGESPFLYALSLLGAFLFSSMFALRFGLIFSDPLTGFRLYNRTSLVPVLAKLSRLDDHTSTEITKILLQNGCEIAEMPISYGTFNGFTNTKWRFLRSLRNAWRIFF